MVLSHAKMTHVKYLVQSAWQILNCEQILIAIINTLAEHV